MKIEVSEKIKEDLNSLSKRIKDAFKKYTPEVEERFPRYERLRILIRELKENNFFVNVKNRFVSDVVSSFSRDLELGLVRIDDVQNLIEYLIPILPKTEVERVSVIISRARELKSIEFRNSLIINTLGSLKSCSLFEKYSDYLKREKIVRSVTSSFLHSLSIGEKISEEQIKKLESIKTIIESSYVVDLVKEIGESNLDESTIESIRIHLKFLRPKEGDAEAVLKSYFFLGFEEMKAEYVRLLRETEASEAAERIFEILQSRFLGFFPSIQLAEMGSFVDPYYLAKLESFFVCVDEFLEWMKIAKSINFKNI
jgi:hypothetical protein